MIGARPPAFPVLALLVLAELISPEARAEGGPERERIVGDEEPPEAIHELVPGLSLGIGLEVEVVGTSNLDLDSMQDDDVLSVEPKFKVDFEYEPNEWFTGFVELELNKILLPKTPDGSTSLSTRLEVKEAYVKIDEILPYTSVQLGRSKFEDQRKWLYDEELDGVRFYLTFEPVVFELSATRLNLLERDLFNDSEETQDERVNNYFALAHFAHADESRTSLYLLVRDDLEPDGEDLVFTGIQSVGELGSRTDYWLDFSVVQGSDGPNDVLGVGVDVGVSYTFDLSHDPALTLGLAYGSGDANPDGWDGNFRQTGLEENEGAFTGVADFQYYGQVLNPELSNLTIFTAGLGVRPSPRTSVDLIYHYYRQNEAADTIRESALETDPDGIHRGLGMGLDLVFGYQAEPSFELRFILGWFFPGPAFPDDASNAYFGGLEAIYQF